MPDTALVIALTVAFASATEEFAVAVAVAFAVVASLKSILAPLSETEALIGARLIADDTTRTIASSISNAS